MSKFQAPPTLGWLGLKDWKTPEQTGDPKFSKLHRVSKTPGGLPKSLSLDAKTDSRCCCRRIPPRARGSRGKLLFPPHACHGGFLIVNARGGWRTDVGRAVFAPPTDSFRLLRNPEVC